MKQKVSINKIYKPSPDVVARQLHGEFIIIPITSGIGDLEDEIFTLNSSGQAIWEKLDGMKSLKEVARALEAEFNAPPQEIEQDILGITQELYKRRMVVEVS
jgi:hypothetical protein